MENGECKLTMSVQDNGDGLDSIIFTQIMDGHASSIKRASDEKAYGEGLDLVMQLIISLNGTLEIFLKIEPC